MDVSEVAAQLRQPQGENGQQVAAKMNQSNRGINLACLRYLQAPERGRILEIGPGNGAFVPELLQLADGLRYTGLDWSADMVALASQLQQTWLTSGQARFVQGDAAKMPFAEQSFERVLAINTLYFWQDPEQVLSEIRRVLCPAGQLCLALGDRSFMQQLPFTAQGFRLYDGDEAKALLRKSGFQLVAAHAYYESALSQMGDSVDKHYHILLATPLTSLDPVIR